MSHISVNSPRSVLGFARRTVTALFLMTLLVGCGTESTTATPATGTAESAATAQGETWRFDGMNSGYSNTVWIDQ